MEQSYWFQQHQKQLAEWRQELLALNTEIVTLAMGEPYQSGVAKRMELENKMRSAVNAERKSIQKDLDSVKNRQLGPKWNQALANVQTLKRLLAEKDEIDESLIELEEYKSSIQPVVEFLCHLGYLRHNDSTTLTHDDLGLKGLLATEVNEGHPLLMTELYMWKSPFIT